MSKINTVRGTIKRITQLEKKGEFQFRKLILSTDDKYPQTVAIDFTQNNVGLLDVWNDGDQVEVFYNLRGREYERDGKIVYFTSVNGWSVKGLEGEISSQVQAPDRDDDLPF